MSESERIPPSKELQEHAADEVVELLRGSLQHAPGEWRRPTLSRQNVVTLLHYIEELRHSNRLGPRGRM